MLSMPPSGTAHAVFGCCMMMQTWPLWPCTMRIQTMCIMSGLPSPHGKKNWRHTMRRLENSPEDREKSWKTRCNCAKMIKHVENLYSCCAVEFGAERSSSAGSTEEKGHFFVSIDDLIRGACIAISFKRSSAMALYHSTNFYHSCFPVCKRAQIHHRMEEVMVRMVFFSILLQGPYQDHAPILPWRRRQPAGSAKGSATIPWGKGIPWDTAILDA